MCAITGQYDVITSNEHSLLGFDDDGLSSEKACDAQVEKSVFCLCVRWLKASRSSIQIVTGKRCT